MPFQLVSPNVYELSSGVVNLWLVDDPQGLTLIDTNYTGKEDEILAAVEALGKKPADIRHILLTHCHPDHIGSLAALKRLTGAQAWMHRADAEVACGRAVGRPIRVAPGLVNQILFRLFIGGKTAQPAPVEIENEFEDGQMLPLGGIRAVHCPGHSEGHTAFLIPSGGGVLVLGDACANTAGLDYSIVYADLEQGRRSLARLAGLEFQTVCFSHGKRLQGKAAGAFRRKWS